MEMFLAAVACYGVGVLTLLFPHEQQRMAHWLSNILAAAGSAVVAGMAAGSLFFGAQIKSLTWGVYSLTCDS